ncbi:hypothetical protein J6590_018777, partial [Homalodisca vitripennis]
MSSRNSHNWRMIHCNAAITSCASINRSNSQNYGAYELSVVDEFQEWLDWHI